MFLKEKEFELSPDVVNINRKLTQSTDEQLIQMYKKYCDSENHYIKMIIVRHLLEDRNYKFNEYKNQWIKEEYVMKFTFYEYINVHNLEQNLKKLALEKDYKLTTYTEKLNSDEIINTGSNSAKRAFIKVFLDGAEISSFYLKHRKHNYVITVGQSKDKKINGINVTFDNKPFKQLGKLGVGGLALATFSTGGLVLPLIGLSASTAALISTTKRMLTIKGPLKNDISEIIDK